MMTHDAFVELFGNPGPEWRGKPFWSWNGKLEKEELLRQIDVMKEMGLGGYFMHSRTGLKTEYLSDEWFDLINACAEKGLETGMESWIYDEDRWPSGTCGGLVSEKPENRARFLRLDCLEAEQFDSEKSWLALFTAELNGFTCTDVKRCTTSAEALRDVKNNPKRQILAFSVELESCNDFYNGYTWIDTLNPRVTEEYLESTHEKYREHSSQYFGGGIKGNFTDEPNRGTVFDKFNLKNRAPEWLCPWTDQFSEIFEKRFGYDLLDRLPEIYLHKDGIKTSQVKWHYMELLQQLFLENYAHPIHEWHQKNNLILTGHILHEDSLSAQTAVAGSVMRYYEHMDYPGIDILGEYNRNYHVVKQLRSSARQFGRESLLSELYGCSGWQVSFEGHKWVGDWQALFGINLRCHHLSWYTMEGEAKRDLPASILHQSAWYRDYEAVESYFARFHTFMAQGEPVCDLLVLNPVESLWCRIYPGASAVLSAVDEDFKRLEKRYTQLFQWLAGSRMDFDYGDEEITGRLGSVEKDEQGPVLKIGKVSYRSVLVSGMDTIRSSTLQLLEEFRDAGGTVIFAGDSPALVDALPSSDAKDLADSCVSLHFEKEGLIRTLKAAGCRSLDIRLKDQPAPESVFASWQQDGDVSYIVMINTDRANSTGSLEIDVPGTVAEEWDFLTGERYSHKVTESGRGMVISTEIPEAGTRAFVVRNKAVDELPVRAVYTDQMNLPVVQSYSYELDEDNVCELDRIRYRFGNGEWICSGVLEADAAIRKSLGIKVREGSMVQPWFRELKEPGARSVPHGQLEMEYPFSAEYIPAEGITLCMERPDMFQVELNGNKITADDFEGWWIDTAYHKCQIPSDLLQAGENTLTLKTEFTEGHDLEAVYLTGSFGVKPGESPVMTRLPETLKPGCITTQGFPYYGGRVRYRFPLPEKDRGSILVRIPDFEGALVNILSLEGNRKTVLPWKPFEADVSGWGDEIFLEVVLTRINTFGALRGEKGEGPYFHKAGLLSPPELVRTNRED
ncbi:MAG: glycosyl hydrolase [Spirochaetales bacterium]|nr:glycosyl hydrolase [Spirochaetales bacterium]